MFWFWGVDAARANVDRYERKMDKAEFKYIIKSISIASKHGFTGLEWEGSIRPENKRKLKDLGYHITNSCIKYKIIW